LLDVGRCYGYCSFTRDKTRYRRLKALQRQTPLKSQSSHFRSASEHGADDEGQDREAGTGFAESSLIADVLETALFEDSTSLGVRFCKHFNPIPSKLLALLFTVVSNVLVSVTWVGFL
jgi:hypothetical protein